MFGRNRFLRSSQLTQKMPALSDYLWTSAEGRRMVKVVKMTHPIRLQTLTLVPVPRIASAQFYDEWVYQPYLKEHIVAITDDITPLTWTPVATWKCGKPETADIEPCNLSEIPDALDCGVTAQWGNARIKKLWSSWLSMMFIPIKLRDKNPRWLRGRIRSLLGEQYTVHPAETDRSYVFLFPAPQTAHFLKHLTQMGFTESESVSVDAGPAATIDPVESACDKFNLVFIIYYTFLVLTAVIALQKYTYEIGLEEMRKLREREAAISDSAKSME